MVIELSILAMVVIDVLKRRFWVFIPAVLLLPLIMLALLLGNEGEFAEEAPGWLIGITILTPVAALVGILLIPRYALPNQRRGGPEGSMTTRSWLAPPTASGQSSRRRLNSHAHLPAASGPCVRAPVAHMFRYGRPSMGL